jgi:DNA mismatch repair ATPase MutS
MSEENKSNDYLMTEINNYFKLPIYYNNNKTELKQNIVSDLELVSTIDPSCNPIYTYCFNNNNDISKILINQISKYYTTDKQFLIDNQTLLKNYNKLNNKYIDEVPNYKNITDIWKELKTDIGFKEKYYYVDWNMLEFLNKSDMFLQFMSMYNLFSPILTLIMPIIILIIPFFVIRLKGLTLNINEYLTILKIVAQQNALGKLFTVNLSEIQLQDRIYILISAAFYLFSIYQNINVCFKFYKNMTVITKYFTEIKLYLNKTLLSMNNYLSVSDNLITHKDFNNNLRLKIQLLTHIYDKLNKVSNYNICSINKFKEVGYILKLFYELHNDKEYEETIMYSFGFNGYIDCLEGLQNNIREKKINFANFIKEHKQNVFKKSYYASLTNSLNHVKNTVKLKKNIIITGPNASGKTTIIKTTMINIILTQQFGCGFYKSAKMAPYNHIHCYLNIPDTSGRDSLFQAEARRCKEILDIIDTYKNETHFCVFDELYSGTNPEEAEISAIAFMNYITKYNNVSCLLTTHFINVCKKLKDNKNIINYNMNTTKINDKLKYLYSFKKGISEVKGGLNILHEMNYPKEIIDKTMNNLNVFL